eukprot:Tbor_TRINITY_DN5519_c0_g1::TRINITY_DN5519_c0_g1_i1::g.13478::m.13478/K13216/PPP1R8, NIPP1; nuclear inhibitor of protein phosphatase 1
MSFLLAQLNATKAAIEKNKVAERRVRYEEAELPKSLADNLSPELISACGKEKLIKQSSFFECPSWAGMPNSNYYHCEIVKEGIKIGTIKLVRYPYFLFGQNTGICDIAVEHPSCSKVHCALVFHKEKKQFYIIDLSTNGVFINSVRIGKNVPVEIEAGTKIQLGGSTRVYIMRSAPLTISEAFRHTPRNSNLTVKHPIIDHEVKQNAIPSLQQLTSAGKDLVQSEDTQKECASAVAASPQTAAINSGDAEKQTPVATVERHFLHLLIKHADVDNPVSKAPRNKGEPITRSMDDAHALALSLREQYNNAVEPIKASLGKQCHEGRCTDEEVLALQSAAEERKEEIFRRLVSTFSECGSAKKGGDLGLNTRGDLEYVSKEFDIAAFSLNVGGVSRPVKTTLGIHLIFRAAQ